jgi:hypothetical protein
MKKTRQRHRDIAAIKTPPPPLFEIVQNHVNVHTVYFRDVRAGWEQWVLLSGDRHHDNAYCDVALEQKHLELARERNALILDVGDLFDAMQGKGDKRSDRAQLKMEHSRNDYFNVIVKDAATFYAPFAAWFGVIGRGNHETSVTDKHGTDLTDLLVHRLNSDHAGHVFAGGYGGWVRFMFVIQKTVQCSLRLKYFHGAGGGGPVTRGVIDTNRQAVYLPDADIVVNGHTHDAYHVPVARERLSEKGIVKRDIVHFIRTATYKDEYRDGSQGWHIQTGKPPKPVGAAWLKFKLVDAHSPPVIDVQVTLDVR